ncbi:ANTAR domain-containing protein [Streptomyces sp. LMG1-1-1.1]|uniref:ANTAR domain-containing protein n=1 Tax=Streptomyces sp. LMG1-1-1.1 TaxID=3135245 RepID=UPI00346679C1
MIEQAKGVLMAPRRISAEQAGQELARRAQASRRSLAEEARIVLDRLPPAPADDPVPRHTSERDTPGHGFHHASSARFA